MSGCVLRVSGVPCPSQLSPLATFKDAFNVGVSTADGSEFSQQLKDATAFLSQHSAVLASLAAAPGFKGAELDFGVWNRAEETPAQSHAFPPSLVGLAAQCGVGLSLSLYAASDS